MFHRYCSKTVNVEYLGFADLDGDTIGECTRFPLNPLKITIEVDKIYWEIASEKERQMILMHEFVHCYFGVDHREDKVHYMNAFIPDSLSYEEFLNQFQEDIKKYCK